MLGSRFSHFQVFCHRKYKRDQYVEQRNNYEKQKSSQPMFITSKKIKIAVNKIDSIDY